MKTVSKLLKLVLMFAIFGCAIGKLAASVTSPGNGEYSSNFGSVSLSVFGENGGDAGALTDWDGTTLPSEFTPPIQHGNWGTTDSLTEVSSANPMYFAFVDDDLESATSFAPAPTTPGNASLLVQIGNGTAGAPEGCTQTVFLDSMLVTTDLDYEVHINGVSYGDGSAIGGLELEQQQQVDIILFDADGTASVGTITGFDVQVRSYIDCGDGVQQVNACTGELLAPEPSSAMLGLLAGLGFAARRRR